MAPPQHAPSTIAFGSRRTRTTRLPTRGAPDASGYRYPATRTKYSRPAVSVTYTSEFSALLEQRPPGPSSLHPTRLLSPTGHPECTDTTVSIADPHVETVYPPEVGGLNR